MPKKKKQPENPKKAICENCVYFHGRSNFSACCNFIFDTGKMRGCEAGENCTKFSPKDSQKPLIL